MFSALKPSTAASPKRRTHPQHQKTVDPAQSPRKEREHSVRNMLMLRAAGMLRRLQRIKTSDKKNSSGEPSSGSLSNKSPRTRLAPKQEDLLIHEIDLWLAQKNSINTSDKLVVPSDPELLALATKAFDRFETTKMPIAVPSKPSIAGHSHSARAYGNLPQTQQQQPAGVQLPELPSPRQTQSARGFKSNAVQPTPTPPMLPPAPPARDKDEEGGNTLRISHTRQGSRKFTQAEEAAALRELQAEEEMAMAKHKTGIKQKRQADLWAQMIAADKEAYEAQERAKKDAKEKAKRDLELHLKAQVEMKKREKLEAVMSEQDFVSKQELVRQKQEQKRIQLDEARARMHEAEKVELMQQMREAELLKRKQELKAKLAEHQMKKTAEKEVQKEAERIQAKRDERAREAIVAVAQNEALRKIREDHRLEEKKRENELIAQYQAALDKQDAKRAEHMERIKEKQTRSVKMADKMTLSLQEQEQKDSQRAARQLEEINAKRETELAKEKEERLRARDELRTALKDQMKEHRDQEEQRRRDGIAEAQQVAYEADLVKKANEQARQERKSAILRNKSEMVHQIEEKQARKNYEATRNMTDAELALNRQKLKSLSQSPRRSD